MPAGLERERRLDLAQAAVVEAAVPEREVDDPRPFRGGVELGTKSVPYTRRSSASVGAREVCLASIVTTPACVPASTSRSFTVAFPRLAFRLPGGSTALLDALYAGAALGSARGRTILVLFTDGEDNMSVLRVPDLLPALERPDVLLQAVGIVAAKSRSGTESGHVRMLRRLAESTGGRFWAASAPESLSQAFLSIAEAMRTRYVLRFEPAGIAIVDTWRSGIAEPPYSAVVAAVLQRD